MNLKDESIRFIIYFILLISISTILTTQRVKNEAYLLGDSGFKESDMQVNFIKNDIYNSLINNIISVFTFDFGKTKTGENVNEHIIQRLEPTFALATFSIILGTFSGIICFCLCIYLDYSILNRVVHSISTLILSTPIFLFSVVLFIIFFIELGLLPPGGYERFNLIYLIMPGISLGIRTFARIFLYGLELGYTELESNLFFILKSRGITNLKLIFKYLLLKLSPILIIIIVLDFSSLLSGAMIVEEIFFFPGIGKSTYTAIKNMDKNLLNALLIYSGFIFYFFNRIARYLQSRIISVNDL